MSDDVASKLDELKAKYGTLFTAEVEGQTIAFRRPNRLEFRAFKADRGDDTKRMVAEENLCQKCVVYPEAQALQSLFDELPAITSVLAQEILAASGGVSLEIKKL